MRGAGRLARWERLTLYIAPMGVPVGDTPGRDVQRGRVWSEPGGCRRSVAQRTPGILTWQDWAWPSHCERAADEDEQHYAQLATGRTVLPTGMHVVIASLALQRAM